MQAASRCHDGGCDGSGREGRAGDGRGTGIGAAIAQAFAAAGADVTVTGRRLAPLAEVAGQITADGGSALAVPADVTDSQAMEAAVTAHEERFGRLDIVVANVGIVPVPGPVLDCPSAVWAEVLQANLTGVWNTARAAGCAAPNITPHPSYDVQLATPYRYHFRADRCGSPAADRLPRYA